MVSTERKARLMKLSWHIQRSKRNTRSKALQAAWAILQNEGVTVYYLIRKLNHNKPVNQQSLNQFSLFTR